MKNVNENKENLVDVKRFEQMISLIYKELYRFIYSIARNAVTSEDCLQNTLLIAYRNFNKLKDKDKFKSWIFTIARHETIKLIKKSQKELPGEEASMDIALNENGNFMSAEDVVIKDELKDKVINAINGLKPEYKQIINLRYYNNFSFEEISDILGVNVNTVRIRHMRAKASIKKYLNQDYFNMDLQFGKGDL